ncbi:hypothetical protein DL96DRAFT_1625399 [Flagelloscypha sp. PMI_526]|nr:hypothetical protein DL96DRAFT_1625399 [Flagelloscypha sp. PMI_526]
MGRSSDDYTHVPLDEGLHDAPRSPGSSWARLWRRDSIPLPSPYSVFELPALCNETCHATPFSNNPLVYSPIQDKLQYKVHVFAGSTTVSGYEGFTNESDAAWRDLYEGQPVIIPDFPIEPMPLKVPNGAYIGQLDIYRQLHCLDYFRQSLRPNRYIHNYSNGFNKSHLLQCLKTMRESLMCSSDISVMAFQWVEPKQQVVGKSAIAHSCRNFHKIREWTRERALDDATVQQISGSNRLTRL